jgi:uncharacterized membrane protein
MATIANTKRIVSVDILRGIVMVIMALDHTRDYFSDYHFDPTDLSHASSYMFFTRWITHFCAPVFVFLAGTSAMLSFSKGQKSKKDISIFLLTRGLWLIFLELTVVRFGWQFNIDYTLVFVQVIWAIGWSMIFLSLFVFLPVPLIAFIGLALIFGHNLLDNIHAESFGKNAIFWDIIHQQAFVQYGAGGKNMVAVLYPLIPWIGVMAAGYCFGKVLLMPINQRDKWLWTIGIYAIGLFVVLRVTGFYGDPKPWHVQKHWWRTVLSILDCQKYPPSLCYLLMTIGPAILAIPLLEKVNNQLTYFFSVYGKVPLFYYVLHLYLLHAMALIIGVFIGMPASYFTGNGFLFRPAPEWGFPLDMVYAFWIVAVLLLYYPCRWFMRLKMENKSWWLSYL